MHERPDAIRSLGMRPAVWIRQRPDLLPSCLYSHRTVRVRLVECDTLPAVAVTVMV